MMPGTAAFRKNDREFLLDSALWSLEEADIALAFAQGIVDEPFRPEDITAEFIQSIFIQTVPQARLVRMDDLGGHVGMGARTKLKLEWNDVGRAAGLPHLVFAKGIREIPFHLESVSTKRFNVMEDKFYNLIRPELPDIAPICHYAKSYPGGRYILVMEDVAERGAEPQWMHYDCSLEYGREAMKTLAILHAKYWESERFHTDLYWARPRSARYGKHWFRELFVGSRRRWLNSEHGEAMPDALRDLLRTWNIHELDFYRYRDENRPQTLCHGDTHLGNTFRYADGRCGLLDWQIIHRGLGISEAAHFVMSAYTSDERRKYDRALFDLYIDALADQGVRMNRDEAWDDWCQAIFYIWDCTLTSIQVGTYGHVMDAFWRRWKTICDAMIDYDTADRLAGTIRRMAA